jgi:hypothetical protein
MLFGNSNIKCVGVRRTSKNNEMIVYLHDPAVDIEDWFGWVDCPNPVGWEVRLSDAFRSEEQLNALIDAFMKEHDQRKQDDENAFRYLLNDYIGME